MKNRYIILSDNKFQLLTIIGTFMGAGFNFEWRASANTLIVTVGDIDFNILDNLADTLQFEYRPYTGS